MPGVIRRPTHRDAGVPDVAVIAFVAPIAVFIQVVIADDIRR
jgi:hypothetical protein